MTNTPNLGLALIAAEQAQKHVTANEAFVVLDGLVHLAIIAATLTAPPGSPLAGDRYIVPAGATGAWAGMTDLVACYSGGAWVFYTPEPGWRAWNIATGALLIYASGAWGRFAGGRDLPWLTPVSGDYMMTVQGGGTTTSTLAGVTDRMDLFAFVARADNVLTGLAVNVVGAVAASLGKIVVYDSDANDRPNAKLAETADLDFSTTGVKTGTVALTLRQGKTYWFGIRHNSTANLSAWVAASTPDINGGNPVTTARKTLRRTLTYATAAPGTWGWLASEINTALATAIWLQV